MTLLCLAVVTMMKKQRNCDHDKNIIGALQRAREIGLRFNASKFRFRTTSVSYRGHTFTAAGLLPDPKKIKAVQEMPDPKDVKAVQTFLGLVNYMARFIPNLTDIAAPLRQLTAKDAMWMWELSQEEAMKKIKKCNSTKHDAEEL